MFVDPPARCSWASRCAWRTSNGGGIRGGTCEADDGGRSDDISTFGITEGFPPTPFVCSVCEFVLLWLARRDKGGEGASWNGGGGGGGINGTDDGAVDVDGMLLNRARMAGMGVATAIGKGGGGAKYPSSMGGGVGGGRSA